MLPWKLGKRHILHVNQNLSLVCFFTCELQPLSCLDLANDIYSQTAKTVFSRLKGSVSSVTRPCLLKITASRQTNMSPKQRCKQQK